MSVNPIIVLIGWLVALAIFCGFIVLLRYINHRERMALISKGINPNRTNVKPRSRGLLRAGLITMMVGFAVTIGLYPVGFILPTTTTTAPLHLGPWLLPGLIPFGVGLALTVSYYLETTHVQDATQPERENDEKVISLKERQEKERGG
jgi:formate hydrogenlyase subunit 3/multisubunit Na+/H+ antiporter MnhD subunit